jgi:hypothetical protein
MQVRPENLRRAHTLSGQRRRTMGNVILHLVFKASS